MATISVTCTVECIRHAADEKRAIIYWKNSPYSNHGRIITKEKIVGGLIVTIDIMKT